MPGAAVLPGVLGGLFRWSYGSAHYRRINDAGRRVHMYARAYRVFLAGEVTTINMNTSRKRESGGSNNR